MLCPLHVFWMLIVFLFSMCSFFEIIFTHLVWCTYALEGKIERRGLSGFSCVVKKWEGNNWFALMFSREYSWVHINVQSGRQRKCKMGRQPTSWLHICTDVGEWWPLAKGWPGEQVAKERVATYSRYIMNLWFWVGSDRNLINRSSHGWKVTSLLFHSFKAEDSFFTVVLN